MLRRTLALALVVLTASATVACSSGPRFDKAAAVDRIVDQGAGRITRPQAQCYVDRVVDEVGTGPLEPGGEPTAEQVPRLTSIRIDCIGVTNLGTLPPATIPLDLEPGRTVPNKKGDDPTLDALHDACGAGDGAACDRLFEVAPIGSEYESFAGSCGGRGPALRCGPEPTTTAAPAPVTPTTAPETTAPAAAPSAPDSTAPTG